MDKFTIIDDKLTAQWQKTLRLYYHWGRKVPSTLAATLAINTLNHLTPNGCYLAKQKLEVRNSPISGQKLSFQAHMTKKLGSFLCRSDVAAGGETVISLSSVLIKPDSKQVLNKVQAVGSTYSKANLQDWRIFTPDEVSGFAILSGDTNNIHSGDNPVVQGMLILLALEDYLASNNLFFEKVEISYVKPVRTNIPVKLLKEEKNIYGIVDDSVSFKLNFQEGK